MVKKIRDNWYRWLPWVVMVVGFCATMLWMIRSGRQYIDSDMSSEMIYAHLLNEEGGIISSKWWFSTEIRLFNVHLFYQIGLLLFPTNWYAARVFGQALWMIALLAAYLYLCSENGLGLKYHGVWGAACLACPFGLFYLWFCYYGGLYIPYIILVVAGQGLIVHLVHDAPRWRHILQFLGLVTFCLLSGLGGVKGIMLLYLPMFLTSIVLFIAQLHKAPDRMPRTELRLCGISFLALLITVVGYGINSGVLSKIYELVSYERYWNEFNILRIFDYWSDLLTLFGWQYPESWWATGFPIFSLSGLFGAFGYLLAGVLLISIVRMVMHWRELSFNELLAIVLFLIACLVQGSVFAYTTGSGEGNAAYWLPILPLAFVVMQMACETEHFKWRYSRQLCALGLMICIAGASVSTVRTYEEHPLRAVSTLEPVCDWLVDNGYTQGYAEFWHANVMTEWSSGQIEVWIPEDEDLTQIRHWMQSKDHENPPEGAFFVLSDPENPYIEYFNDPEVVYQDDNGYAVMVFDSYEEMLAELK